MTIIKEKNVIETWANEFSTKVLNFSIITVSAQVSKNQKKTMSNQSLFYPKNSKNPLQLQKKTVLKKQIAVNYYKNKDNVKEIAKKKRTTSFQ